MSVMVYLKSLMTTSLSIDTCSFPLGHVVFGKSTDVTMPMTSVHIKVFKMHVNACI